MGLMGTGHPLLAPLTDTDLDGAACVGYAPLFDDTVDGETATERAYRHHAAARICNTCPVRRQCATVAATHQAIGVWAAQVRTVDRFTQYGAVA